MPELSLQQAFDLALQHHQAGKLSEAETLYRQILAVEPNQPETLHYLGVLAHQLGQHVAAVELIGKALQLRPAWPAALSNQGEALRAQGLFAAAAACYRQAIALAPEFAVAHNNLGNALKGLGQWDQARAAYRQAIALQPDYADAYFNLGTTFSEQGAWEQASAAYQQAIALRPDMAEAYHHLGVAQYQQGQLEQATASFQKTIELDPSNAQAHFNLGNAQHAAGQLDLAITAYQQVLAHDPQHTAAHYNLANAWYDLGQLDAALRGYQQAFALQATNVYALSNQGNILKDKGRLDEAIAAYRQALQIDKSNAAIHSNLIFTMYFHPRATERAIAEEQGRWDLTHASPLRHLIKPHANDRTPGRRLRIGYLSPDFRGHPVGRFLLTLLQEHDRAQYEIYAYAEVARPDEITARMKTCVDSWRSTVGLPDAEVAEQIRSDKIDILVDLAMHMANNRLMVMAYKPAPVQANYLAYVGNSGLTTVDYRLSDPYLDPHGGDDSLYCEQTIRLPETYWCYEPPLPVELGPAPVTEKGGITFGCLNNFCKVNDTLIEIWAEILRRLPAARLLLHAHEGDHRQQLRERFAELGVDAARVEFLGHVSLENYFQAYHTIDISLDTSPYAGGTTTCDSLWMGVPVVTLAGDRAVGRGGVSILNNIGLPEMVAQMPQEYIEIAVALAKDRARLVELRATLRERMLASPLMDAPRFARHVEAAYRGMWQKWCESGQKS